MTASFFGLIPIVFNHVFDGFLKRFGSLDRMGKVPLDSLFHGPRSSISSEKMAVPKLGALVGEQRLRPQLAIWSGRCCFETGCDKACINLDWHLGAAKVNGFIGF